MLKACHSKNPYLFIFTTTNTFITNANALGTVSLAYRRTLSLPLAYDMTRVIGLDMFLKLTPVTRLPAIMEALQCLSRKFGIAATSNDKLEPVYQRERGKTLLRVSKRRELFAGNRCLSICRRKRVDEALKMLDQGRGTA